MKIFIIIALVMAGVMDYACACVSGEISRQEEQEQQARE